MLDGLESTDRFAELLALRAVVNGQIEDSHGQARVLCGHSKSAPIKGLLP